MDQLKYYYEAYNNRSLPEEEQGYALITLISASEQSEITNAIIGESIKSGKKVKLDFAAKSLQMNRKHVPKVYKVKCPLFDKVYDELSIDDIYRMPQFKDLYEEVSNAAGDINILKDGLKKR